MALKNKSMYAILGILNISQSTGYDIKKYCDKVLSGFWNENFGHIYPTLKKMVDEKMIAVVSKEESDKKICYEITEKGRQHLKEWLLEETMQQPVRSEFMLKLLFSSSLPIENTIQMLEKYKKEFILKKDNYLVMQDNIQSGLVEVTRERACFLNAMVRRGILSAQATIQWCDETIEEMGKVKFHS